MLSSSPTESTRGRVIRNHVDGTKMGSGERETMEPFICAQQNATSHPGAHFLCVFPLCFVLPAFSMIFLLLYSVFVRMNTNEIDTDLLLSLAKARPVLWDKMLLVYKTKMK